MYELWWYLIYFILYYNISVSNIWKIYADITILRLQLHFKIAFMRSNDRHVMLRFSTMQCICIDSTCDTHLIANRKICKRRERRTQCCKIKIHYGEIYWQLYIRTHACTHVRYRKCIDAFEGGQGSRFNGVSATRNSLKFYASMRPVQHALSTLLVRLASRQLAMMHGVSDALLSWYADRISGNATRFHGGIDCDLSKRILRLRGETHLANRQRWIIITDN